MVICSRNDNITSVILYIVGITIDAEVKNVEYNWCIEIMDDKFGISEVGKKNEMSKGGTSKCIWH